MTKKLKKIITLALVCGMTCMMFGCGKKDPVRDAAYAYMNEVAPVQELQKTAILDYNALALDPEMDSQHLAQELSENIIPRYEAYVQRLNEINVENEEVKAVHDQCIEAANMELEVLKQILAATEACDLDMLTTAESSISTTQEKFASYQANLKTLATEHGIVIEEDSSVEVEPTETEVEDISE